MSESISLLGTITQAQYEDWLQRVYPRLEALSAQTILLAQKVEALSQVMTKLQSQTEAALTTILAQAAK